MTPQPPIPSSPVLRPSSSPSPPLRIAIWIAVSSKQQADKTSLADQERLGREFADAVGGHVVALYTVPGHTRDIILWSDAERAMPAYKQLRHDITAHTFDVLWSLDVDRLGRDPALSNQVYSLVEKSGAEVYLHTAPHTIGQKTVGHRYLPAIQSVRAAEDQARRVHHQRLGMVARVRKGLVSNRPPYGYTVKRDPTGAIIGYEFTPEIAAVHYMTELYLSGHPYTEIHRRIATTPHPPPQAGRWHYATVRRILLNDAYAGYPTWDNHRPDEPSPYIPPAWDPDTYAAILQERQRRKRTTYTRHGAGPLTGVAFCRRCQSNMIRNRRPSGSTYLLCGRYNTKSVTGKTCHCNHIPEHTALAALADYLTALATPAALDHLLQQDPPAPDAHLLRQQITARQHHIDTLAAQRQRIALTLAAGKMTPDIYRATDDRLLQQIDEHRQNIHDLQGQLAALPDPDQRRQALTALASAFPQLLQHAEPAELAALLQRAGIQLWIENGQVIKITP